MSNFKCKMCGGTIEFEPGATVGVCDSCGTKQTLPRLDDDRRANLYDRANHFRRNNDFDKAAGLYEQILNEDNTDAEAYWSLVLCRYGIEYVEDPATHKRVPTVNRTQYTSVFDDEDYKSALEHADGFQRSIYEEEAAAINEIQKGILAISQKEEPFDVFICYKDTDDNGRRTVDSVLANDLYHQLTLEGFKVFYSRITLEDKLGSEYEPYIFAALNSAKVMVVLGTKPEYFNAVWVKNEWSRYLKLIKAGEKKTLIPAYRDMDPYDLPDEFSHLMAQDMSKLGFMQDLIRGIKKITAERTPKPIVKETVVVNGGAPNINPLLKRAFMFLEDGDFKQADEYCERVLDQDPENARAYLGKLMAELRVRQQENLKDCKEPFDDSSNYAKAIRFGDESLVSDLKGYINHINERNENERLTGIYDSAWTAMQHASDESAYKSAAASFRTIPGFKDADTRAEKCLELAEECRKNEIYAFAKTKMVASTESSYKAAAASFRTIPGWKDANELAEKCLEQAEICRKQAEECRKNEIYDSAKAKMTAAENAVSYYDYVEAIRFFRTISGWRDADQQILTCQKRIEEIKAKKEAERLEKARKAEQERIAAEKAAKKRKKIMSFLVAILIVGIAVAFLTVKVIIPNRQYSQAIAYIDAGDYEVAYKLLNGLNYKDSADKLNSIKPQYYQRVLISNAQPGSCVYFGTYEQDNNSTNGKEDIEWLVLAKEDNRILVISRYGLDCQPYNTTNTSVTWETCTLREWLNGTFLNGAFSAEEQAMIPTVTVSADKNPSYNTDPGNAVQDKVFLLSIPEANEYFSSDEERKCVPTEYAIAQGTNTTDSYKLNGRATCWWWLRSPGFESNRAAYVIGGSAYSTGRYVRRFESAIRPALWINLES